MGLRKMRTCEKLRKMRTCGGKYILGRLPQCDQQKEAKRRIQQNILQTWVTIIFVQKGRHIIKGLKSFVRSTLNCVTFPIFDHQQLDLLESLVVKSQCKFSENCITESLYWELCVGKMVHILSFPNI